MRDLIDDAAHEVAAERSRVANEGWGARLLALQGERGYWGGTSTASPATAERAVDAAVPATIRHRTHDPRYARPSSACVTG